MYFGSILPVLIAFYQSFDQFPSTFQKILFTPSHVPSLEYIIVHEMIHLLERHHNEHFIAYMNSFMPLWQYYREELNRAPLGHESWEY